MKNRPSIAVTALVMAVLVGVVMVSHRQNQNLRAEVEANQVEIRENIRHIVGIQERIERLSERVSSVESGKEQMEKYSTQPQQGNRSAKQAREGQTPVTASPKVLNHVDGGTLTIDDLANLFRDRGFSITRGPRQTIASLGPIHVRVSGSSHIREIFVTGEASTSQEENAAIVLAMTMALSSTVPWGRDWVIENLDYTIRRALQSGTGVYAKNDIKDDVFLRLEVDLGKKLVTLEIERYEKGVSLG